MDTSTYTLNGDRYLTTGQVAKLLDLNQRTVLLWSTRIRKGTAPEVLQALVWTQVPTNNRTYFREDTILAFKKVLDAHRPKRIRNRRKQHELGCSRPERHSFSVCR